MAEFTVTQCFPTGRTREWTSPEGKTVVFNKHSVQFAESPGQTWEVERSGQNPPPTPGQKLQGDIVTSPKGAVYFKEIKQKPQWNENQGGGGYRKYGGGNDSPEKQQSIMVQTALKEAVNVMIATQQYDIAKCQYYVQGFMEIMTKVAGMTVEAAAPAHSQAPVAQPMQQPPQNGHQQPVNRVAQYAPVQQPVYQQQPQQYAQAPQQQYIEPGMSEGDYVPF